jgi:hypothetical protein
MSLWLILLSSYCEHLEKSYKALTAEFTVDGIKFVLRVFETTLRVFSKFLNFVINLITKFLEKKN